VDFSLTDEQRIIRETARSLFGRECTPDLVRRAWEEPESAVPLWRDHLQGWLGLSTGPLADVALFMEEHGRALAPGVFFATLLAAFAASAADEPLEGSATVAVAGPDGIWTPNGSAEKHFVPSAAQVRQVVVVGGSSAAPRITVLGIDEVALAPVQQMDESRPLYCVRAGRDTVGRRISPQAWQQVVHRALVACAAELVGVGRHLLDSAVEYASVRQQFGRPIGSFQGLQWKLVDAALELERAASAVAWAALCVDAAAPEAERAVHCAKLETGLAARRCARTSLQVHGGIGYTWEHGLHFWLRRAYAGDAFMGPSDYHARCLAALLFAA
jgi:alkylation response protein AidB-like acyl-CoA dehydrogenase